MGDDHLDVVAREVHERVQRVVGHVLLDQVAQAVARVILLAVEDECQACVQIGVVLDHLLDDLFSELVVLEDAAVGCEAHQGTVFLALASGDDAALLLGDALVIEHRRALAVAHTADVELCRQCVHSLDAHAIQTHRPLVGLRVILGSGVHFARRILDLVQRNAAAIVTYGDCAVGHLDVDGRLGVARVELIDAVVDHLLDEHIDAVIVL